MNQNILRAASISTFALLGLLAGCGGGGDDNAGAPAALQVVPSTTSVASPDGSPKGVCFAYPDQPVTVFIYGGAAPYTINNSNTAYVNVTPLTVSDHGGSFVVTYLGGCITNGTISIVDKLNTVVVFTVNNTPAASSS